MVFMNAFREIGDALHATSFLVLLCTLLCSRSAAGLSLRTQELYLLLFCARYSDLAWNFLSMYNWYTKCAYITLSFAVVVACHCAPSLRNTYNQAADLKRSTTLVFLVLPALILGIFINQDHMSVFEVGWAFSIYLEAVAIVPQLVLVIRERGCRSVVAHYTMLLGMYKTAYVANWAWRFYTEENYLQKIVWASGAVQVLLYLPFFFIYCREKRCLLRPDAPIKLEELDTLLGPQHQPNAMPEVAALDQCRFRCPSCRKELQATLRDGLNAVHCLCGESFQVDNTAPPPVEKSTAVPPSVEMHEAAAGVPVLEGQVVYDVEMGAEITADSDTATAEAPAQVEVLKAV